MASNDRSNRSRLDGPRQGPGPSDRALTHQGLPLLGLPAPVLRPEVMPGHGLARRPAHHRQPHRQPIAAGRRGLDPADSPRGLAVYCPNPVIGIALLGLVCRLGPDNPAISAPLREAGRLRLAYPGVSLAALAHHTQPH